MGLDPMVFSFVWEISETRKQRLANFTEGDNTGHAAPAASSGRPTLPPALIIMLDLIPPLAGVFAAFSLQNSEQQQLYQRFQAIGIATLGAGSAAKLHFRELTGLEKDEGGFQTVSWYRALTQKTLLWADVAEANIGRLVLCSDNDVSLLPGWAEALTKAFAQAGSQLDLVFQREGGEDPFCKSSSRLKPSPRPFENSLRCSSHHRSSHPLLSSRRVEQTRASHTTPASFL